MTQEEVKGKLLDLGFTYERNEEYHRDEYASIYENAKLEIFVDYYSLTFVLLYESKREAAECYHIKNIPELLDKKFIEGVITYLAIDLVVQEIAEKPTLALVRERIAQKGLSRYCDAQAIYDYWENKEWSTGHGEEIVSLETAIALYKVRVNAQRSCVNKGLDGIKDLTPEKVEPKKKEQHIEKEDKTPYEKQLQDKRWKDFRNFVFAVRGKKCEICGGTHVLQVHHPKYIAGRKAWEYPVSEVMVLCRHCHQQVHNLE